MNLYDAEIEILIDLLKTQPELFSEEDKISLLNLIDSLPNDKKEIANNIDLWYENHFHIQTARSSDEPVLKSIGGQKVPLTAEEYKEIIKNAIREASEEKTKPQNQSPKS